MEYEVEVIRGLTEFAERELRVRLPTAQITGQPRPGRISVRYRGDPRRLNELRSVVAVHRVQRFDVPRPRALLGQQAMQRLLQLSQGVMQVYPRNTFRTLRLSAAGTESPILRRLRDLLAENLGLTSVEGPGDLLVALRRTANGEGWEVLVRTSPRPLAARSWRVCDLPGALNATVAHAMVALTDPSPSDRFLNLACGSGTLLIERLAVGRAAVALGIDNAEEALACGQQNALASGFANSIVFIRGDATRTPFRDQSMTALVADLPFGMLVGMSGPAQALYSAILAEAARLARPGAPFVVITTRRKILEQAVRSSEQRWQIERVVPLELPFRSGYLRPAIYALRRRYDDGVG